MELSVICDVMMSMWRHCNGRAPLWGIIFIYLKSQLIDLFNRYPANMSQCTRLYKDIFYTIWDSGLQFVTRRTFPCDMGLYVIPQHPLQWRHKKYAGISDHRRLFAQPFVQSQIKEIVEAPRHWPLWGESTGDRGIPATRKMLPFDLVIMSISVQYHI